MTTRLSTHWLLGRTHVLGEPLRVFNSGSSLHGKVTSASRAAAVLSVYDAALISTAELSKFADSEKSGFAKQVEATYAIMTRHPQVNDWVRFDIWVSDNKPCNFLRLCSHESTAHELYYLLITKAQEITKKL